MRSIGIIPSRYASTRFPGKPLIDINGKTMIQRVYEQATLSNLNKVIVATDDARIANHVKDFGGSVLITSPKHQSGTDRCYEAYEKNNESFNVVVNIQGDEPFIKPEQINNLIGCFKKEETTIATLYKKIKVEEELFNPNRIKVVKDKNQCALYFSRSPIPYNKNKSGKGWLTSSEYYRHIGIYAYRPEILKKITQLSPTSLEISESLEQLRWLENGFKITLRETKWETPNIDTPEDLENLLKSL